MRHEDIEIKIITQYEETLTKIRSESEFLLGISPHR